MKTFKRNAVIITVLLFVCVAAYLNWSYNKNSDSETVAEASPQETEGASLNEGASTTADVGLYYQEETSVNKEYFDTARLNRQQARDAAAAALATVSKTEGASQEMIDASLQEMSQIASLSLEEARIEDLIKAKGFADCVVYISESDVNITVAAPQEGLAASSVAKITDIVTSQTDYKATDLKITEVK